MENKKCIVCSKEFAPLNNKGDEQKYCSHSCRYKAANERRIAKIRNEAYNEANPSTENNFQSKPFGNNNISFSLDTYIEQLKEIERAKAEKQISEIKHQYEIMERELLDRIMKIEEQIVQDDEDDEDDQNKNFIGAVNSGGWIGAIFNSEFGKELARNPKTSEILGSLASILMKAS
jgi:hypothetical protein